MNLIIARPCSNSCPYCFETGERRGGQNDFITMANVQILAEWARKTHLDYLSILGGEPFLHPELTSILSTFRRISPSTGFRILTGGVFKSRLLDDLSPDSAGLIFNINEPRDYVNPKHFSKVINNVETAIRRGFRVILGFNVWRTDFDPTFMPRLAHSLARTNFRWTVANPQKYTQSKVLSPGQYQTVAERCIQMLETSTSLGIEALLDCPLPLCFFNDEQLAWVKQYHEGTASRLGVCDPIIDVTPELEALRCFALSKVGRVKVTDFSSEQEIRDWFLQRVDYQLLGNGCFERCADCHHFKTGRCYGGCLAWHKAEADLTAEPPGIELAIKMQDAMDKEQPAAALEFYDAAGFWAKAAASTYIAATAAAKLEKWELVFRYSAIVQDTSSNPELKRLALELLRDVPLNTRVQIETAIEKKHPFVGIPDAN
ncbi:Radical SAM superfamily enzyme, MoaA/NifB/PqqE/SkfB family [Dehalogenimonas formicexedens]|uniref:Radical SAM superfamily enzyme, MoaA/NifB/PqqE/SkfB family n=1 Tax=Dehalogenimonas formicexedens TaxID=1839801 RepID=A0A1P8F5F0_9CHLR|nr:radical SAM protein [Dehalogenimonas formicexedens]APV43704.1 Radical SAM superfamily enzyme, MoaA/NifB/PqqE/SkfB family [Dehalogenimonas formicexedens]